MGDVRADRGPGANRRGREIAVGLLIVAAATGAGLSVGLSDHSPPARRPSPRRAAAAQPARTLRVVSVTPPARAIGVSPDAPIALRFSQPLARHPVAPRLYPPVPGSWAHPTPTTLVFRPTADLPPLTALSLGLPGGNYGPRAVDGAEMRSPFHSGFTVAAPPVLRLQQLLAELGYLPVSFESLAAAASGDRAAGTAVPMPGNGETALASLRREPRTADEISLLPEPGEFIWRYRRLPTQLRRLWTAGSANVVTEGAVMAFEADHALSPDGVAGRAFWQVLLSAVAQRQPTHHPYNYVIVSETLPERLFVWSNGKVVYETPTNTGISVAPTPLGTWPVYLRFVSTTMSGTNPDGSHYSDPGVPWVAYFYAGDAVHGFVRPGYGYPQSLGCVELPIANAAVVYSYDTYGTLVTVTTGDLDRELGVGESPAG